MNICMQIGMSGESLGLYTAAGSSAAKWGAVTEKQPLTWNKLKWEAVTEKQPLTWYKVSMIFAHMKVNKDTQAYFFSQLMITESMKNYKF